MRAALYLRRSTARQETSLEDQRAELTRYAAGKGYGIVREYVDDAISGDATEKRVAFQAMVRDAASGDFGLVLCWDQDRFGRFDALEAGYWIKPLRDHGVVLETIAQGRINWGDFAGRIVWSVVQEGKHAYLRDLARNCARGCRESYERGVYPGRAPYGYRKRDKRLVLGPPEEVEAVRRIFAMRLEGYGSRAIALRMSAGGFPHPCKGWNIETVRNILAREAYTGCTIVGAKKPAKYESLYDEPKRFEGTHEPIIDRVTWLETRKVASQSRPKTRNGKLVAPFSGLLVCGLCGSLMHCLAMRGQYGYVCGKYKLGRGCAWAFLPELDVAAQLAIAIESVIAATVDETQRWLGTVSGQQSDTDANSRELARLERQIETATERILTVNDAVMPQLRKKIDALVAKRDLLQAKQVSDRAVASPREIAELLHTLPNLIRHASRGSLRGLAVAALKAPAIVHVVHLRSTAKREFYGVQSIEFAVIDGVPR